MNRRDFLRHTAQLAGATAAAPWLRALHAQTGAAAARVAFVKTSNRADGVKRAIELLKLPRFAPGALFLKPNFNSADETPGSTHPDTLRALVGVLRQMGAGPITLGDRSGMGQTRDVLEKRGVFSLGRELSFDVTVFDELPANEWEPVTLAGGHWQKGFHVPRALRRAGTIVQTCCLKTHRYGGHFTLSLKNSVGLAAKQLPSDGYNYMRELHGSPHQRRMIAEINTAYRPALIVLDGVDALVTGGPDTGKQVNTNVVLAGTDRVAVDAVGVALLRMHGTTPEVSAGSIFSLDQIARAVELRLGVGTPGDISLVTADADSESYARKVRDVLLAA